MKKRFLSLILVLAMMVGVFTPLIASAADNEIISKDENAVTNTVTLHKLMMNEKELTDWKQFTEEKYDGTQGTADLLKNLTEGHSAHEVAGVYFALKFAKDYSDTTKAGKYVKASGTSDAQKLIPANPAEATDNIEEAVGGLTNASGIEFTTSTLKGKFEIDEITSKTTYTNTIYYDANNNELVKVGNDYYLRSLKENERNENNKSTPDESKTKVGTIITASKAVPVKITLPLVNSKGTVLKAHVYPKNTENKPQIDKNFGKKDNTTDNKTDNDLVHADGFDDAEKGAGAQAGAKYENYSKTKETAKAEIGKTIPYEVKTKIPANSKLATAKWDDKMTEGLTYNKDLVVKINGTKIKLAQDELIQTDNGFELNLKGDNLALLNGKDKDVEVELQYSAKVNKDAMADIPESNNVMFHYGNNPSKSTTPIPTNPKNGELEVKKTWDDGVWAEGETATFKLIDANTGKVVTADDLVAPNGNKEDAKFKAYKEKFSSTVTIGYEAKNGGSHKWEYLDDTKEYIAKETASTSGSDAEYKKSDDGTITVVNHRSDNPTPLNPTSPKVVTGGKKFVKTNDKEKNSKELERLAGAEFYVKKTVDGEDKYLVATAPADEKAVKTAKTALDTAVDKYNKMDKKTQESEEGQKAKADVDAKQKAYNKAVLANATAYTWGNKKDTNVVILTSDEQGRFEITGLEYGTYKLEEKTAPKDYAKISDVKFTVAKGSYDGKNAKGDGPADKHIQYNKDNKDANYGLQVINKKVTIPQTGGIGTIIFTAIGLAIMASAIIAIKKRQATEAR